MTDRCPPPPPLSHLRLSGRLGRPVLFRVAGVVPLYRSDDGAAADSPSGRPRVHPHPAERPNGQVRPRVARAARWGVARLYGRVSDGAVSPQHSHNITDVG